MSERNSTTISCTASMKNMMFASMNKIRTGVKLKRLQRLHERLVPLNQLISSMLARKICGRHISFIGSFGPCIIDRMFDTGAALASHKCSKFDDRATLQASHSTSAQSSLDRLRCENK